MSTANNGGYHRVEIGWYGPVIDNELGETALGHRLDVERLIKSCLGVLMLAANAHAHADEDEEDELAWEYFCWKQSMYGDIISDLRNMLVEALLAGTPNMGNETAYLEHLFCPVLHKLEAKQAALLECEEVLRDIAAG